MEEQHRWDSMLVLAEAAVTFVATAWLYNSLAYDLTIFERMYRNLGAELPLVSAEHSSWFSTSAICHRFFVTHRGGFGIMQ